MQENKSRAAPAGIKQSPDFRFSGGRRAYQGSVSYARMAAGTIMQSLVDAKIRLSGA
jgi:hypothetical protein